MARTDGSGVHRLSRDEYATRAELDAVTDAVDALADASREQADAIDALQREARAMSRLHWGERTMDGDAGLVMRLKRLEWWINAMRWAVAIVLAAALAVFGTCAGQRLAGSASSESAREGSAVANGH